MFQKLVQQFLQRFIKTMGRGPQNRAEWMQIQDQAVRHLNKTKGAPSITKNIPGETKITIDDVLKGPVESGGPKGPRSWDLSQKKGEVIPFPDKGIRGLMEKGDVTVGTAPKTKKSTLKAKKDRGILLRDADEDIARIKRENKEAVDRFREKMNKEPDKFQYGGIAPPPRPGYGLGDIVKKHIPAEYRLYAKSILPGGESGKVGSDYFTEDFKQDLRRQALEKYTRTGKLTGQVGEMEQQRGVSAINKLTGFPSTYASLGTYTYDIDPKTLDVNITDKYDWNPEYGKTDEMVGWVGDQPDVKQGDVDLSLVKDYIVDAVKTGELDKTNALEMIGNYFGGRASEGKGFDIDIDIPIKEATPATEGSFAGGGIAPLVGEPTYAADFYDDRVPMAGGGALFKFIEKLFIKASNDIRQGKGKWKGLDQKQRIVQHDNLTKKVTEFQKTGNTEGLEVYFGVNPNEAFAAAKAKVKKPKIKDEFFSDKDAANEWEFEMKKAAEGKPVIPLGGMDERTLIKTKYPGISDDLLNKILIDDNPQRKADVLATMDQYLKLREVGKHPNEAFDILAKDMKKPTKHAEGGRADFIFGGSTGLKAMWKQMMKGLSKKRGEPITKLFPKLSADERRMEKLVMGTPEQKAFREGEVEHKLEGIDLLINRLKHDKKILERQAKNKAMKDEGLDFLMKQIEQDMPDIYGPHLKKYTNIDKDILQMENIKKNLIMKDRKLNAYGGRIGYAGGGKTGLPAVTMGTPQMNMQQPQMPAGPQPAGIPGGTIVAQNQMQQSPWMGSQMPQGPGGMPQRGQPRPGGMNPMMGGQPRAQMAGGGMGRRAFLKLMAGLAALPLVGTGVTKVAPKAIKAIETIKATDAAGMPAWFPTLVERVIKEGDDISKGAARIERETVHTLKLPESGTELTVYNDLIKGNVTMEVGFGKHGNVHGKFGQPYSVHLKKGDEIEEGIMRGKKEPDEFVIEEAEFTGGHPENVKFEDSAFEKFGDEVSDLAEIEAFAKKTTTKKLHKAKKTKPKDVEGPQADWDDSLPDDPDDFYGDYASGGLARMLGE